MSDVELRVSGKKITDWTSVSITMSIEQLAHSFNLRLAELNTAQSLGYVAQEGSSCEIWVDGEQLIVGYIDVSTISYDAQSHSMTLQGRSTLGDLIDCSVDGVGQIRNQTLGGIAQLVCQPFGITVRDELLDTAVFRRFAVQHGETVIELLQRAARARGALLISGNAGELLITTVGVGRSGIAIERGVNVLSGKRTGSWVDRFSSYRVYSQNSGGSGWHGRAAAHISATASDSVIDRYRPLVLMAESQLDRTGATKRANWERNVRSGKTKRLTYRLHGWNDGLGLWKPNKLVSVFDEFLQVCDDLLVAKVTLSKGPDGEIASLEIAHKEAYSVLATPLSPKGDAF